MSVTPAIRPIIAADAARIAAMAAALSAHEGQPPPPFSTADVLKWGFGPAPKFEGLVAECDGFVCGYALFQDSFNIGIGSPGLQMLDLFVEPDLRRLGIGRAMLGYLAKLCLERGGRWITWQSMVSNTLAMNFYQTIGSRQFRAADFELAGDALQQLAALASLRHAPP